MIIFLADGRFGNQVFQYAFLRTIQKGKEKIIASGFEELQDVFEIDGVLNLNKYNKWIRRFLWMICKPVLDFLSDINVVASISVDHEEVLEKYGRETLTYTRNKGLFNSVTFVRRGFFQSESFFDPKVLSGLKIRDSYSAQAENFLKHIPGNMHKIFVHIRRGDYKNYKVYGESALLPMAYFKQQIDWFVKNRKDPYFIFLSDEPELIEEEFAYLENKLISSDNHYGADLAIMTLCNSGILSPSSFCWWGGYLMKNRDILFAPKYWLGFGSGIEYQSGCVNKCMVEVKVAK